MLVVRSQNSMIFIDEIELVGTMHHYGEHSCSCDFQGSHNLCSGSSYCISILETFYVWYGSGSIQTEREAARNYALKLSHSPETVIELSEGENDDDEMFWLMLGEHEYARAEHWRWRKLLPDPDCRIFKLEDRTQPAVSLGPRPRYSCSK